MFATLLVVPLMQTDQMVVDLPGEVNLAMQTPVAFMGVELK